MRPIKKVEIICASVEVRKILTALEKLEVSGYTLIRDAEGMGDRGRRLADEVTDVFKNSYILVCCSPEMAEKISQKVQPSLKKFGGVCLVSDAQWIRVGEDHPERKEP
ncbi:MAG: transcriptional regulator [Candidatus Sumerlaeia bacterium]|nr:transcriptional regulator [Candidatus Sumerlaeia bacterium]